MVSVKNIGEESIYTPRDTHIYTGSYTHIHLNHNKTRLRTPGDEHTYTHTCILATRVPRADALAHCSPYSRRYVHSRQK